MANWSREEVANCILPTLWTVWIKLDTNDGSCGESSVQPLINSSSFFDLRQGHHVNCLRIQPALLLKKSLKDWDVLYMYILKGSKAHLYSIQGCIHMNKCNCECMENWFHSTVCSCLFCSGFSTGVELVGEFSTPITPSLPLWAKPLCSTIQIQTTLFDCNCCIIT